jgi:hypothetical protein
MIIEVEASQLGALDPDHLDAAEIVAMKVSKLRQALSLCDTIFAAMTQSSNARAARAAAK